MNHVLVNNKHLRILWWKSRMFWRDWQWFRSYAKGERWEAEFGPLTVVIYTKGQNTMTRFE